MKAINFISDNWKWIAAAAIILSGTFLRLKSLWKGSAVEWLVSVCADAERVFGGGTGYLKLRYAYDAFIEKFPVFSKYISFKTFSKWVDIALDKLKEQLDKNRKIKNIVSPEASTNADK